MQKVPSVCPKFEKAFQILGKKWNGLIIEVLLAGETHFSMISAAIPELSDRMLSARLRELEEMGIIERIVDTGYPVQVTYRLTDMGIESKPILEAVHDWADKWYADLGSEKSE
ncbi:helix-turn-helix transcriptional regulator [Sporolactobacillus sp. CPB3-1]|uniref:Helix-turn-helix transcriptional regulator n=1 Tax=Sporolactobacillus mangiferae TaxID=2940498 RepID=A0ABT0MA04_9BACL|nr:helix-turn-helix domain-containing protein [Sporolactobacillus mangiferae]MCL1631706.1 helix-turn-helix transcriptional regulator [Sporolactobacillus mangiferae]